MPDPKINPTALLASCALLSAAAADGHIDATSAETAITALISDSTQHIEPLQTKPEGSQCTMSLSVLDWDQIDDQKCLGLTRFSKGDIETLVELLGIANPFRTKSRCRLPATVALSMLLARLAYPNRLSDLHNQFGYSSTTISLVATELGKFLFENWAQPLLTGFNTHLLTPSRLDLYASAVHASGAPMDNVWGFMDVTFSCISRPTRGQEGCYSGYKKSHALKYNAVTTPDGLIAHCSLPVEGRRADGGVLAESGFEPLMEHHARGVDGRRLFVYTDPAYGVTNTIVSAAKELRKLDPLEQRFYTAMSKARVSVEWGFGKLFNLFGFLDFPRAQRLYLSPIGQQFLLGVFFTNVHTCLYSSITSHVFNMSPPPLHEYLQQPVQSQNTE